MTFVLDTAIGFGVWLPFTLGKTAALLSVRFDHLSLVHPNTFISSWILKELCTSFIFPSGGCALLQIHL